MSIAAALGLMVAVASPLAAIAASGSATETIDFDSLTWSVDRQLPSGGYTVGTNQLTLDVDGSDRSGASSYYYFEGVQASLPSGTAWVDQVDSVGATLTVDPAWASVPGMEAGLWLRSNDPSAPASPAWPTLVVTNDGLGGLNPTNALVAAVFDTFTANWEGVTPVATGDVHLEIAVNPLSAEFEYLVDGVVIFSHGAAGYDSPSTVVFNNYNTGGATADYTVVWTGLELGTKIDPPTITTVTLPAHTSAGLYSASIAVDSATPSSVAPRTFSVVGGAATLPPGLTLNPSTGVLSGTPTTAGTFAFTIAVDNGAVAGDTADYSLTISAGFLAATGPSGEVL
ncbi:MAG TPA: Ig domain-containing protein, partial [Terrimesophilobacter sp.]|nr:Ig domain-containing protein [Terrimesophilobacter sp.]